MAATPCRPPSSVRTCRCTIECIRAFGWIHQRASAVGKATGLYDFTAAEGAFQNRNRKVRNRTDAGRLRLPNGIAGRTLDGDGPVLVEGALVPVRVDRDADRVTYVEPNVWVHHDLRDLVANDPDTVA